MSSDNLKIFDIFPVLKTNRLDLVEIKQKHLSDLFKLFSNNDVTKYYNIETLTEKKEAQKLIDWFQIRFKEKLGIRWGIALKGESKIIGTIGFNNFTKGHRANIGFDLQKEHWNKGYITEVLNIVIDFGFNTLGINRIEGEVMQGNKISEKVLVKQGFKREGVLRQWMLWNGNHYDMTMYSLLKKELIGQETTKS
ncbi:MAG: GNAT family N-acetyltransferase [Bacteroidales bacterium]|nr:GNAT family N-acetyltransferase [Bacteroidales bacterium]